MLSYISQLEASQYIFSGFEVPGLLLSLEMTGRKNMSASWYQTWDNTDTKPGLFIDAFSEPLLWRHGFLFFSHHMLTAQLLQVICDSILCLCLCVREGNALLFMFLLSTLYSEKNSKWKRKPTAFLTFYSVT